MASLKSSTAAKSTNNVTDHVNFVDLPQWNYQNICHIDGTYTYGDNDDLRVLNFRPLSTASTIKKEKKRKLFGNLVTQKGQSSKPNNVPDFFCEICVETKKQNQSFPIQGCSHVYCTECTAKYIVSKLQENIINIQCPVSRCSGLFELEHCRSILPKEAFDRWGSALCEALILESQKFYCPFKDCSAMLINDGGEVIKESECPNCRRLFCARCKVPWHSGISCKKFQTLHKDEREKEDIMLMNLADDKKWKRCPRCRIYVERTEGCRYMKCRCGTSFCYGCGSTKISALHHNCSKCKG